jgi:hypothetical protein
MRALKSFLDMSTRHNTQHHRISYYFRCFAQNRSKPTNHTTRTTRTTTRASVFPLVPFVLFQQQQQGTTATTADSAAPGCGFLVVCDMAGSHWGTHRGSKSSSSCARRLPPARVAALCVGFTLAVPVLLAMLLLQQYQQQQHEEEERETTIWFEVALTRVASGVWTAYYSVRFGHDYQQSLMETTTTTTTFKDEPPQQQPTTSNLISQLLYTLAGATSSFVLSLGAWLVWFQYIPHDNDTTTTTTDAQQQADQILLKQYIRFPSSTSSLWESSLHGGGDDMLTLSPRSRLGSHNTNDSNHNTRNRMGSTDTSDFFDCQSITSQEALDWSLFFHNIVFFSLQRFFLVLFMLCVMC